MRRSFGYISSLRQLYVHTAYPQISNCLLARPVSVGVDISLIKRTMSTDRNVDLTYEDIINLKKKNEIVLVDVRDHNEIQETGKLPDSVHIPLGELPAALQTSADEFKSKYGCDQFSKDANLVFSCRSGHRSRRALNAATELGFKNSRHYIGGFLDWQEKTKK